MDRKHFLKLMALGGLAPIVLSGCKREPELGDYNGSVLIVGAGAAGLYAGYLLRQSGATVKILEAANRIGGRIKPLTGFADFTIEVGGEEVHGQRSTWHDIVFATNAEKVDSDGDDVFFVNGSRKTESDVNSEQGYQDLMTLINGIDSYSGSDKTFAAYLAEKNIPAAYLPLGNALLGNENGTSNDRQGVVGAARESQQWTAGNKNFLLKNRSFTSILEEKFKDIIPLVQLNTAVASIDTSGATVRVTDTNGVVHEADKVIVTVSVAVLKANAIAFTPALPTSKTDAISQIGMGEGMKVILKFSQAFWPGDTGSIYGSGLVPEWWVTSGGGRSAGDHVLTAFVMGANAASLSAMGTGMVAQICTELDQIFGGTVATSSLVSSHVEDWFADPLVRGTYSYATVGMSSTARNDLAAPVDGKLFFAGEATHFEGHPATVHGALETAYRAVEELVNA